jgi:hypothetical protein
MAGHPELEAKLGDLRTALAQGMTHLVGGIVKAALIAGCSRQQLTEAAGGAGSPSGQEAVRRAVDEWSWLQARRRPVTASRPLPTRRPI